MRRCPLSPQSRRFTGGCFGRWKHGKCLVGGGSWWSVPEVGDHKMLAWEVWASFCLPRRMSELHQMEDSCQTPPALPCLLWKKFMPPTSSTPSMPARIFWRYHRRRWWHMLEPSSIGWRKLTSLLEGSHACWQKV